MKVRFWGQYFYPAIVNSIYRFMFNDNFSIGSFFSSKTLQPASNQLHELWFGMLTTDGHNRY
jgi:hypothetical protein